MSFTKVFDLDKGSIEVVGEWWSDGDGWDFNCALTPVDCLNIGMEEGFRAPKVSASDFRSVIADFQSKGANIEVSDAQMRSILEYIEKEGQESAPAYESAHEAYYGM